MSLEAVIQENTNVMRELIALWKTGASPAPAPVSAPAVDKAPPPAKDKPAAEVKTDTTAKEKPVEEAKATEVTYDQIKPLIIKVNTTKGREAATKLLADFGVARGPDLKPEQYADFFAAATKVLS